MKPSEEFLLHFNELRNQTNQNPKTMLAFFREKPAWRELATKVKHSARAIENVLTYRKVQPQVSRAFLEAWRLYGREWKKPVEYIDLEPLLSINLFDEEDFKPTTYEQFAARRADPTDLTRPDFDEDSQFDPKNHSGGAAVAALFDYLADKAAWHREDDPGDRIANIITIGLEALAYFEDIIGVRIDTAFRRWEQVPAVLVPKHVSDRHGLTEKGSLYELLNDAIRAYVAGAPAAAMAMCRACMEMVLREHYLRGETSDKDSLYNVVELAAARYEFLLPKRMHALRENANRILHDYSRQRKLDSGDEELLLSFFKDLKFYIERVPEGRTRT